MMKKLLLVMLASLLVFGLMNCDSDTTTGEESHYMIQGVWDVLVKETGSPDAPEPYYTLLIGPDRITKTDNYGQVISYKTIFKGKFDNASKDVAGYYQFNYEMLDFKTEDSVGKYEMGYNENTDDLLVYSWSPTGKYVFQEVRILLVNGDTITIPGYTNPEITYARGTGGGTPGGGTGPFTVTFNANGGTPTPPPQTVDKDDKATAPTGVTHGTRTLLGWYRNAAGTGTAWDFAVDTVTANITLYAKWEPIVLLDFAEELQTMTVSEANNAVIFAHAGLQNAGGTYEVIDDGSGSNNILEMTATADWQGIDLLDSHFQFEVGDEITVIATLTTSSGSGEEAFINLSDAGWSPLGDNPSITVNTPFTLTRTLVAADITKIQTTPTAGPPNGMRIRINNPGTNWTLEIEQIKVVRP